MSYYKVCNRCRIKKKLTGFAFSRKDTQERQPRCKACQSELSKAHYQKNKIKYYRAGVDRRHRNKVFVSRYLSMCECADCGEDDPRVLEFDHVNGDKEFGIGLGVTNRLSLNVLKEEMRKCEIRCKNCHTIRHYENGDWTWKTS